MSVSFVQGTYSVSTTDGVVGAGAGWFGLTSTKYPTPTVWNNSRGAQNGTVGPIVGVGVGAPLFDYCFFVSGNSVSTRFIQAIYTSTALTADDILAGKAPTPANFAPIKNSTNTFTTGSTLQIIYDGTTVSFYLNSVPGQPATGLFASVPRPPGSPPLYLAACFGGWLTTTQWVFTFQPLVAAPVSTNSVFGITANMSLAASSSAWMTNARDNIPAPPPIGNTSTAPGTYINWNKLSTNLSPYIQINNTFSTPSGAIQNTSGAPALWTVSLTLTAAAGGLRAVIWRMNSSNVFQDYYTGDNLTLGVVVNSIHINETIRMAPGDLLVVFVGTPNASGPILLLAAGTKLSITSTTPTSGGAQATLAGTQATLAGTHATLGGAHATLAGAHATLAGTEPMLGGRIVKVKPSPLPRIPKNKSLTIAGKKKKTSRRKKAKGSKKTTAKRKE
jgi:hypothetical protein